jgi:hypothetical protein
MLYKTPTCHQHIEKLKKEYCCIRKMTSERKNMRQKDHTMPETMRERRCVELAHRNAIV